MLPAGRKHGKKTRAARSQTREKPSCRKILTLCKVPERGAPKPLPKQRGRAGPGRPDARRNKGRRTSCGRRSARHRRRKRPRTCGACPAVPGDVSKAASPQKIAAGQRFSEERRRCRCREAAKNARMPGGNDARILPERARPGANGRRARKFSPAAPRREKFPKTHGAEGPGSLRCAKDTAAGAPRRAVARASGRGSPPPRNCRNARRKAPERGTKKSGRTPPPATESGRAPSVKTTQMRTT